MSGEIVVHVDHGTAAAGRLSLAAALSRRLGARLIGIGAEIAGAAEVAEWRPLADPRRFALHARYADLAVVGQPEDGPDHVTEMIMTTGRPFLVVPRYGQFAEAGRRIMVAWNGSREATRAVFDAMPLLAKADKVMVVTLDAGDGDHGESPGADISLAIARHGAQVEVARSTAGGIDAGNALLSRVTDFAADLLVMGAFSRHPLREKALGGATIEVLRHMTVPVLMSH
jgi:nucleotide-binding universal stress UspA family protein